MGLLAGALRFWTTPNLYASSLVLKPIILSDPEQMALIDNWSNLLKKKEWAVLAQQFQVNANLFKKVQSIKTEELQKSNSPNNFTAFTLSVVVTDTAALQPLQKGIEYALDNSEYIKEKLAARKIILRSMIQTVQQEITHLVNLQTTIETSLQQNTNGSRFLVSVSDISSQIAGLQEKKLNFEENLSFTSAVQVLQNFYTTSRPTYTQLFKQLLMGLAGVVGYREVGERPMESATRSSSVCDAASSSTSSAVSRNVTAPRFSIAPAAKSGRAARSSFCSGYGMP
jgi:hypothetical protein